MLHGKRSCTIRNYTVQNLDCKQLRMYVIITPRVNS